MDVIETAKQLINKKSVTPDDAGCQEMLIQQLTSLGFEITQYNKNGVHNFWATHGNGHPVFCFAGHTDVVPAGDESAWNSPPFQACIKENNLFGRGAADMKSAIAAMLVATNTFLKKHHDHKGTLAFLITSDEEGPSEFGTQHVVKQLNTKIDYCLVGEATSEKKLGDQIKIGRRGSLHGILTVKGKQGHIAYPEKTSNPIHTAAKIINTLNEINWDSGNAHFPATHLQFYEVQAGVGAGNVVPPELSAKFNFRYSPESSAKSLENKMTDSLKKSNANFTLLFQKESPGYYSQPGKLTEICKNTIHNICQITPTLSTTGGTSDGRFIAKICNEVIELGPINETIHQVNEHINLDDLKKLTTIYTEILEAIYHSSP